MNHIKKLRTTLHKIGDGNPTNTNSNNSNSSTTTTNTNNDQKCNCDQSDVCTTAYPSYSVPFPFPVVSYIAKLKPLLETLMTNMIQGKDYTYTNPDKSSILCAPSFNIIRDCDFIVLRIQLYDPATNKALLVNANNQPAPFDTPLSVEIGTQNYDNPTFSFRPVLSPFETVDQYIYKNLTSRFPVTIADHFEYSLSLNGTNTTNSSTTSPPLPIETNFSLATVTVNDGYTFGYNPTAHQPTSVNLNNNSLNNPTDQALIDLHFQKMAIIKLLHTFVRPKIFDWNVGFETLTQFASHNVIDDIKNGLVTDTVTDYFQPIFVEKVDDLQSLNSKLEFYQAELAGMQNSDPNYATVQASITALQAQIAATSDTERLSYLFNDSCSNLFNPPAKNLFEDIILLYPNFKTILIQYPQMTAFAVTWVKNPDSGRFEITNVKIPHIETNDQVPQKLNVIVCQFKAAIDAKFRTNSNNENAPTVYNFGNNNNNNNNNNGNNFNNNNFTTANNNQNNFNNNNNLSVLNNNNQNLNNNNFNTNLLNANRRNFAITNNNYNNNRNF